MSTLDDARTLLQDIVSPDLKALGARVDALETNMKQRFDAVEKIAEVRHELLLLRMETGFASVDAKFAATDARFAAGFAAVEARFVAADARFDAILKALNVDRRLELLEAKEASRSELHA
jgi:hypothetical protein